MTTRIGIIGAGPSGLYLYKRLTEARHADLVIDVFENGDRPGCGMPYSSAGANLEHVTNVSSDETPPLVTSIAEWAAQLSPTALALYGFDAGPFNEHKVLPRLMFGDYLAAQFVLLRRRADENGIRTNIHLRRKVADVRADGDGMSVTTAAGENLLFEHVIICTGHNWLQPHEGTVSGYFDSPYPPAKLARRFDHPVAILGSSLTAIDAVRTLARQHGTFMNSENGRTVFQPDPDTSGFRIVMHSRHGLLPALRFHTEHTQIGGSDALIPPDVLARNRAENDGFLSLDFVFAEFFIETLRGRDDRLYESLKDLSLEQAVALLLEQRESREPFDLFRAEYAEAERSIRRHESIHWKEALASLSFAMNYPAKHFSGEDMLRLKQVLMPLISVVIAFAPQSSARELIALHDAGRLDLIAAGPHSRVEPAAQGAIIYDEDAAGHEKSAQYATFIDCTGQPHLSIDQFPFRSLVEAGTVSPARLKFRNASNAGKDAEQIGDHHYLHVPGLAIDDSFRAIGMDGIANPHLHLMAVPYMAGYNPDYSGLDFCEEASARIAADILGA